MTKAKLQSLMQLDWANALWPYFQSDEFKQLNKKIVEDRKTSEVYPLKENIFRVFDETPLSDVRVVIIGQDPYHNSYYDNTPAALGRAFACDGGYRVQPSLKNIFKELESDIGSVEGFDYTLQHWVDQGVLLLNTALTVTKGQPGSHAYYWNGFTKQVMKTLNTKDDLVFILWGNHAKSYKKYLNNPTHKFIESAHPSPFSCKNFFGTKPFSKCNEYLKLPINWLNGFQTLQYGETKVTLMPNPLFMEHDKIEIIPPKDEENE